MNLSGSNYDASPAPPSPPPSSDEYKPLEWAAESGTVPCSASSLIEITRTSKKDRAVLLDSPEMTIPRQLQIFSMNSIGSEQNFEDKDQEIRQLKRKVKNLKERLADFTAAASEIERARDSQAAKYEKQKKHLEEEMRKENKQHMSAERDLGIVQHMAIETQKEVQALEASERALISREDAQRQDIADLQASKSKIMRAVNICEEIVQDGMYVDTSLLRDTLNTMSLLIANERWGLEIEEDEGNIETSSEVDTDN